MPSEHKCMKCDKQATHKITKIVDGKVHDIFLCDEHAQEFSPYIKQPHQHQAHLVQLLQQILKQQEDLAASQPDEEDNLTCPNCGLKFSLYRKTLLLGCSDCYEAFEEQLLPDLRRMHGVGAQDPLDDVVLEEERAAPASATALEVAVEPDTKDLAQGALSVEEIKTRMQKIIENEDFEEAARLRDSIRTLENVKQNRQIDCGRCGAPMEPKMGHDGPILVCSEYPKCKNARPLNDAC